MKITGKYSERYYQACMYCTKCHSRGPRIITVKTNNRAYNELSAIRQDPTYKEQAIAAWNKCER